MAPLESLLTADEVAPLVRRDAETVRRWARTERIPAIRLPGGGWMFKARVVDAIVKGEDPWAADIEPEPVEMTS